MNPARVPSRNYFRGSDMLLLSSVIWLRRPPGSAVYAAHRQCSANFPQTVRALRPCKNTLSVVEIARFDCLGPTLRDAPDELFSRS